MAAGIPEDVPPVAAHEAQAFQAFVIDGVTKQLQKDNKAERLPEFIRAAGAYGKGDLDADAFLLTLADLFGEQRSLKLLPSLARLVKNDDRRRSLLKAARGGAVEVLGADSPNGAVAAAPAAAAPEPPAAVAAPPTPEPAPPAPAEVPPAPEAPAPPAPTPERPEPPAAAQEPAPEPPAQAPAPAPAEEPPAPAPAPAAGDAKKKKKKKKKGRRPSAKAEEPAAPIDTPAPAAATPEEPEEPSTPTPTVPADPALFTPRPATPEPTVPADPSLFTPVAFAAASREMIEELTAPDIIPRSNVLPTDAVAGAQAAADERAQAGYDADGNQGGPYTEDKPPPGFVFSAYRKGCTGIVWKAAESTKEAPAEPQATEPESAAAGEAEWERQLAALEAEKKAQQAAAEEAKAPENPPEKRRAVAAFTAAENWQMSVKEGDMVEAIKDHEDGWTECLHQGTSGAVPTTYLEKVVEKPSPEKSTLATGNEAAELQRDAVRRVRTRLDQLNRSERLPELVQGTRRYAAGDLTASGMRSALADLLSSDEEARIVCRTLARLVVDDQKRNALAAAAETPAIENEDFFAAVARDTAELRQQKSEEEDRRVSTSSAAEDEREILLARSHGVGVSPDVVTRLQRLQEDEELAKRLQREEERRKSNSYAELSRQRTDAALAERLARTPAPEPPKEQSFWGSLFGEDEETVPPHSPETDRKVQEDADAALARRLQAEEHARAARRRTPQVYDTPTYSQPAVQYDQYGRPSQAPYRQPQPPPPPAYASEPSVDEYGRPVMQQQTRAPSYAPPPRQDYEPQARRYVPPAPPPAPPPYAHSMRGSLGSAPYSRPAAPAPAPPPPPVVEEAGDLFSCGACGAQMQVRGAEPGAQFTCTECGAVNEI